MRLNLLLKISIYLCLFFSAPIRADIQVIAKTGWTAAGFPSHFTYSGLSEPVIGPSGHVAFAGLAFDGSKYTKAVWSGLPGQLEAIIKENDTISGFPANVFFSDVGEGTFLINRSGVVAFQAKLKGANTYSTALVHFNGVTYGILKATDQAPGFPPGTVAGGVMPLAISDAGLVLGGMTTRGTALWFWDFEKIERISTTIGECGYLSTASFAPGLLSINQAGSVVFSAALSEGDNKICSSGGVFKWSNGKTELIIADGDPVPGMPDAVFGVSLTESPPKINDQDEIIFTAKLIQITPQSTNNSIWIKSGLDDPRLLILSGEGLQEKPDHLIFPPIFLDSNFANYGYSMLRVNANGLDTLLAGNPREIQPYDDPSDKGSSQLTTIASQNDQPPGFEPSWFYNGFSFKAINNAGQYVFAGLASNALENRTILALWRGTGTERPRLIIKDGMKFSVDNIEHILKNIDFLSAQAGTASTAGGRPSWFSDHGEIVFRGSLDNDSNSAILLITDDSKEQKIFNLAEQLYPQFFSPANVDNQLLEGFVYRHYSTTNTYIGIRNGEVFVLGDAFGSGVQRIDTVDNTLRFLESMAGS